LIRIAAIYTLAKQNVACGVRVCLQAHSQGFLVITSDERETNLCTLHVEAGNEQTLTIVADPGYYKGEEILECKQNGFQALVPKVDTSGKRTKGQFTRTVR